MMRRQGQGRGQGQGQYGDSGANAYAAGAPMHHMSGQRMEHTSSDFEGRMEAFTPPPETDNPFATSKSDGQWRWERDGSMGSNPLTSNMYNEGQRTDSKHTLKKQSNNDSRSQPLNEEMDLVYEDKPSSQTFEDLEKKFLDDIRNLAKEQSDAENAENARHREKIGAVNAQYQEQLASLRSRHAKLRGELLERESNARRHQYQQSVMDRYPNSSMVPSDHRGYSGPAASAPVGEARRGYNTDQYDSYNERARFLGGSRDHGFESRGPYPGGRVYDTGSRYY